MNLVVGVGGVRAPSRSRLIHLRIHSVLQSEHNTHGRESVTGLMNLHGGLKVVVTGSSSGKTGLLGATGLVFVNNALDRSSSLCGG